MKQFFLTFALLLTSFVSLFAQQNINQVLTDWYLEERFILVDQDRDALLDQDEIGQFPQEFGYYMDPRNFLLSDTDGDGKLSYRETKSRVVVEFNFRYAKEVASLGRLFDQNPTLKLADASYLKANPELTTSLLGNLYWMNNNPVLARSVYSDQNWMQSHTNALASLQRNLCWLVTHPADAKSMYKQLKLSRQAPEMMSWRAAHKHFLRRYNELPDDIILSFLPKN